MLAVTGYYDGVAIRPLGDMTAMPNQKVIITLLDDFITQSDIKDLEKNKKKNFMALAGTIDIDAEAVSALREGSKVSVWTNDKHFERIKELLPELQLYKK